MAILSVGSGQQYSTISAAVSASRDGDVVQIQAGTYVNDFATVTKAITLQGVGGMAKLVATTAPGNGKGILVTNADVTIDNLEFSGAKVPSGNGARIRYEGGHLTVTDSYFHDNQNGLLANADADGSITIRGSEFGHNGSGDGYTHNSYVNQVGRLDIDASYFHDAVVGHEIKSRALSTSVTNSRIQNEAGSGSYNIDLPNGGRATIAGNVLEQGPASDNPAMVSFGVEGNVHAGSGLEMRGNTFVNDLAGGRLLVNATGTAATIADSKVFGLAADRIASGPATVSGTTTLSTEPALDTSSPWAAATPPPPPTDIRWTGTTAAEVFAGGAGNDLLDGMAGNDRLAGNDGNDTLYGRGGADSLSGGNGADLLHGGGGNDTLEGGAGNDRLVGSLGVDLLTGGTGADRFIFNSLSDRGDTIADFDAAAGDRLDLRPFLDAFGTGYADLAAGGYVRLVQATAGVQVQVDADGGGDAYATLVTLAGKSIAALGADFILA